MREFKKSSKLDNVLYDVRGPVVDEAARLEKRRPTNFKAPTSETLLRSASARPTRSFRICATSCPNAKAIPILAACSRRARQSCNTPSSSIPNVDMDGIYTGNGVSELIQLCMQALLDNGDEILIPAPDYPLWTACATLAGGTPVHSYFAMSSLTGSPTLPTWNRKSRREPRRSSSSTRTTPQARCTRAKCSSKSSNWPDVTT